MAALLLLAAQIVGLPSGFGCLCGGDLRLVAAPVCQPGICHLESDHHERHAHDGVPCDEGDHDHEHQVVMQELLALQAQSLHAPAPSSVTLTPMHTSSSQGIAVREWSAALMCRMRDRPPPDLLAKRRVVLLV